MELDGVKGSVELRFMYRYQIPLYLIRLLIESEGKGRENANRMFIDHFESDLTELALIKGNTIDQIIREY